MPSKIPSSAMPLMYLPKSTVAHRQVLDNLTVFTDPQVAKKQEKKMWAMRLDGYIWIVNSPVAQTFSMDSTSS